MPLTRPKKVPAANLSGNLTYNDLSGSVPVASMPAGSVLQVKSTTLNSMISAGGTNSNSGVGTDFGLSVAITPKKSGSYFVIHCHVGIGATTSGNTWATVLSRGGSRIGVGETVSAKLGVWYKGPDHAGNNGSDNNHGVGNGGVYYDTTANAVAGSAITYICAFQAEGGTARINHNEGNFTGNSYPVEARTSSTMVVYEIAQ